MRCIAVLRIVEVVRVPPPPVLEGNEDRIWSAGVQERLSSIDYRLRSMVEAGGVEPPSEKRYATEPTCLSQFRLFRPPRLERARNAAG